MKKTIISVIIAVFITAVVVACAMYYWQANCNEQSVMTTWQGESYSFEYPSQYIADEKGLWTADGYQSYVDNYPNCSVCQFPLVGVSSEKIDGELVDYVMQKSGVTSIKQYDDFANYSYAETRINGIYFTKVVDGDLHEIIHYYTIKDDKVVEFTVYQLANDNQILRDIISTLSFE